MRIRPWLRVVLAAVTAGVAAVAVTVGVREGLAWHRDSTSTKAVNDMRRSVDALYHQHSPMISGCRSVEHSICVTVTGEPEDVAAQLTGMFDLHGQWSQRSCDRFRPRTHSDEWQSCTVRGSLHGQGMTLRTSTAARTSTGPHAEPSTDVGIFAVSS